MKPRGNRPRPRRPQYYRLIGRLPIPVVDIIEWARWFETADRTVAKTEVGPARVSTVFLGLDHNWSINPDAPPLLFETMIFADLDGSSDYCNRYSTWFEAERGHALAVEHTRAALAAADEALGRTQC
jgi:hypothetical protein